MSAFSSSQLRPLFWSIIGAFQHKKRSKVNHKFNDNLFSFNASTDTVLLDNV